MITPELIAYIRAEFAKGRTREQVHAVLVAQGGWTETDLSEAFRTVIPMQGLAHSSGSAITAQGSVINPSSVSARSSSSLWKIILTLVILGALCFAGWFYRAPLIGLWNSGVNSLTKLSTSLFGSETDTETTNTASQNNAVIPAYNQTISVKDCGISTVPDLENPLTYQNDAVLACLGNSALHCENAKAVLEDDLFPNIFQIIKNQDTCSFRLSYGQDSTLVDITGKNLALQYISCPISIVKAVDVSKKIPSFNAPSVDDLSKYASQVYFYGTLGLFMEHNVDKNIIQNLGCSGPFIDTVIASYRKMQEKTN